MTLLTLPIQFQAFFRPAHLVAEKEEHYRGENGSPSRPAPPPPPPATERGGRVYVLSCLFILYVCGGRVGGKKGVQHWGMCTCNFSSFDTVGLL